jgi:pimeloyl-ACP methyl ester carboxylesterase
VEHLFIDAGRLRMHLTEAGEGKPIVMLHGWPQHWYVWRRVIPLLAPHARILCPDLRGFGWTDAPSGGYERETMAQDVLALLDELGLESVDLVGHDWGGWVTPLSSPSAPDQAVRGTRHPAAVALQRTPQPARGLADGLLVTDRTLRFFAR